MELLAVSWHDATEPAQLLFFLAIEKKRRKGREETRKGGKKGECHIEILIRPLENLT